MKISRGRNPEFPEPSWHGFSVQHCVSRSVRDSAAVLDATQGPAAGDRWWAPAPAGPYLREVDAPPSRLRIAFTAADSLGRRAHPECVAAVEATARLCESLGHHVEEAAPQLDGQRLTDAFLFLWGVGVAASMKEAACVIGPRAGAEVFEPITRALGASAAGRDPADVGLAWRPLLQIGYVMAQFHQTYDVLLTPVLARPPVPLGAISQEMAFDALVALLIEYAAYTPTANITGQPAMSVPLHWTADGLPVGSHFTGRFGDEATLFRLAGQLERARPWAGRRPPVSAA
jgi:amidase